MKLGVPPLNILISISYILFSALIAYWLKLAHRKQTQLQQKGSASQQEEIRKSLNWSKLFGVSWLKKYTLVGACFNSNKKYLVNQAFIMSIYAVTCLKINKIILWPVTFILFLLPLGFVVQVAVYHLQNYLEKNQKKTTNQTVNNIINDQIQIQAGNQESFNIMAQVNTNKVQNTKERSIVQILCVSLFTFITLVLLYQTIFTLTNSISNSGQLNITSLIIIMIIDQSAVRVPAGLLTFAILKVLQHQKIIDFGQNNLVNWICQQEFTKAYNTLYVQLLQRREQQRTSSPLKGIEPSHNMLKQQQQQRVEQSSDNQCLNLLNLQPETHSQEDALERQVYLTTPEKELFQGNQKEERQEQEQNEKQQQQNQSILHTLIDNKENQTINNELNKSTLKSHQQSKGLQDILTSKEDNVGDTQNLKMDFNLQNSRYDTRGVRKGKRRPAKRVLKLTGNSPYLQYLPNMLKNIDKVKNVQKQKKML